MCRRRIRPPASHFLGGGLEDLLYELDARDEISSVNEEWLRFARVRRLLRRCQSLPRLVPRSLLRQEVPERSRRKCPRSWQPGTVAVTSLTEASSPHGHHSPERPRSARRHSRSLALSEVQMRALKLSGAAALSLLLIGAACARNNDEANDTGAAARGDTARAAVSDSGSMNQTESGVTDSSGQSTLGSDVEKTSPDQGQPVTSKGDTLSAGADSASNSR
jgi:hypothetical protein